MRRTNVTKLPCPLMDITVYKAVGETAADACRRADEEGLILGKYQDSGNDATSAPAIGLSVEEATDLVQVDPGLVFIILNHQLNVDADGKTSDGCTFLPVGHTQGAGREECWVASYRWVRSYAFDRDPALEYTFLRAEAVAEFKADVLKVEALLAERGLRPPRWHVCQQVDAHGREWTAEDVAGSWGCDLALRQVAARQEALQPLSSAQLGQRMGFPELRGLDPATLAHLRRFPGFQRWEEQQGRGFQADPPYTAVPLPIDLSIPPLPTPAPAQRMAYVVYESEELRGVNRLLLEFCSHFPDLAFVSLRSVLALLDLISPWGAMQEGIGQIGLEQELQMGGEGEHVASFTLTSDELRLIPRGGDRTLAISRCPTGKGTLRYKVILDYRARPSLRQAALGQVQAPGLQRLLIEEVGQGQYAHRPDPALYDAIAPVQK